jgi:phage-related protein
VEGSDGITKGIIFGNLHSYRDLKLILSEKEIGAPHVKTNLIDIEGADGSIDLTDFFGVPKYGNVTHKFTFHSIVPWNDLLSQYSEVKNALHGKRLRIILDDDPSFYYVGRCYVSSFTNEKNIGTITIECECEPYKYKLQPTLMSVAVNGTEVITLTNSRKRAVPAITTTAAMTIAFGDGIWTNSAGTYTIPELELVEGENDVTVTGVGNITFTWREGSM